MARNFGGMSPATPPLPQKPQLRQASDLQPAPSIGRTVHYITTDPDEQCNGAEVCAAVITGVRSDTVVNLKLILDGPVSDRWVAGVPRENSFVPVDGFPVRFWRWPPRA